ncbi:MAG: hypothetical protein HGB19_03665 [Chlorobiales bacterium]|nr:hypothetical protein [Chlorobiales bacterium]
MGIELKTSSVASILFLCTLIAAGCRSETTRRFGKKDLLGNWEAITFQQINKDFSQDGLAPLGQFPVDRYGYVTLYFQSDTLYELSVKVVRDVVVTREVMGQEVRQKLLSAESELKRSGKCLATDTTIILFESLRDTLAQGQYFFDRGNLHLSLVDRKGRKWNSVWQKE